MSQTKDSIRRPLEPVKYQAEIDKTIAKATIEGKADNTIRKFRFALRQLSRICDLMNPEDVQKTIAYSKVTNSTKMSYVLVYE